MPEMKNSNIEWIGEIPSDWIVVPVKHFFSIGRGRVISVLDLCEDGIYPVYSSQTENNGCFGYLKTYDYSGPAITWTTDGAKAGTVFFRDGKYNCTNVCGILKFKNDNFAKSNIKFMTYAIGMVAEQNKRKDINGYKIMSNEMANIKFAVPPIKTQNFIANLLDQKCSEIDSLSADIQSQIDVLEEYKKSIITEAVTKGLNPDVEMKDSGIEWVGIIPKHWKTPKLKYVAKFYNGDRSSDYPSGNDMVDEGIIFISSNNIHNIEMDNSPEVSKYITEQKYKSLGGAKVNKNDIIFCLRGSVGICSINTTEDNGALASSLVDIRTVNGDARFINYFLHSTISEIQTRNFTNGSCAANLSAENVSNYYFLQPPIKEQKEIADYLDGKCAEIDTVIADKKAQLETLAEYKKSLIYEYVTGKKEVKINER